MNLQNPNEIMISVVILTKDSAGTIELCLSALKEALNASQLSYEIIIVDGYSKDDTLKHVKDSFPDALILQDYGNLAQCRKKGIETSHGEFICMIDSDIVIPRNFFDMLKAFENPEVGCISGRYELTKDSIVKRYYDDRKDSARNVGVIESRLGVGAACTIYRGSLLRKCLPDERLITGEDTDMALSINDLGYKALIDTNMFCAHVRKSGLLDEMRIQYKFGKTIPIIFERHLEYEKRIGKRRILSILASLFFPFYYLKKTNKHRYAVIAWLFALSYNLGYLTSWHLPKRYK
jgi:glycosyltransferase involved in cell wall biosynthesis